MQVGFVLKRLGVFFIIVWAAASVNFILPRATGENPIRQKILQEAASGGYLMKDMDAIVEQYTKEFGLDRQIWIQYLDYLWDLAKFDLGKSITNYPTEVSEIIALSIPWTIGLLTVALVFAFLIGTIFGALLGWERAPKWVRIFVPPLFVFSSIPYYLLGLVVLYFFAFKNPWFPLGGAYGVMTFPENTLSFWLEVLKHALLPGMSMVLAIVGFQALGMRAMMITTQGEDYMILGEAKGLGRLTLFFQYAVRNAMLPQITTFALSLGHVASGAVLVEIVFSYPGLGDVLYQSVMGFDFFVVQGVVFILVLGVAISTLLLDLFLPLLDPRIISQKN